MPQLKVFRWSATIVCAGLILFPIVRSFVQRNNVSVPADDDEAAVFLSAYYLEVFLRCDRTAPEWRAVDAKDHPPFGKYLHGFALMIGDVPAPAPERKASYFRADAPEGTTTTIDADSLRPGRILSFVTITLAALLLVVVGRCLGCELAGWIAALFFAWHPATVWVAGRLLLDGPLVLLVVANLLVQMIWLKESDRRSSQAYMLAACAGLLGGCAFATKITGVIILPAGLCALILTNRSFLTKLRHGLLFSIAFIVVGIGINPFLWSAPIQAFGQMITHRAAMTSMQTVMYPNEALFTYGERGWTFLSTLLLHPDPLYRTLSIPILTMLGAAGGFILFRAARAQRPGAEVWLTHAALWGTTTILTYRMDWPRYLLPLLVFAALAVGFGLAPLIRKPSKICERSVWLPAVLASLLVPLMYGWSTQTTPRVRAEAELGALDSLLADSALGQGQRALLLGLRHETQGKIQLIEAAQNPR